MLEACRQAEGESHLAHNSGRYPLCGRGDINTYALFAETNRILISPTGHVGCILPSGIATDDTTKYFFQDIVKSRSLASLYHFENEDRMFPAVHHAFRFCLRTLSGSERPVRDATFVAYARSVTAVNDPDRRFSLHSSPHGPQVSGDDSIKVQGAYLVMALDLHLFGDKLRRYREQLQLSLGEVSHTIGIGEARFAFDHHFSTFRTQRGQAFTDVKFMV